MYGVRGQGSGLDTTTKLLEEWKHFTLILPSPNSFTSMWGQGSLSSAACDCFRVGRSNHSSTEHSMTWTIRISVKYYVYLPAFPPKQLCSFFTFQYTIAFYKLPINTLPRKDILLEGQISVAPYTLKSVLKLLPSCFYPLNNVDELRSILKAYEKNVLKLT
jgi:hypothetical protein